MRLLIIVTTPAVEYQLWQLSEQWKIAPNYTETLVRTASVGLDEVLIMCQAPTSVGAGNENAVIHDTRVRTTPWVAGSANSDPYFKATKIYVASHDPYVNLRELPGLLPGRFSAGAFFHHVTGKPIFDELCAVCKHQDPDAFEIAIETIVHHQIYSRRLRLAQLKYQINKVFAPIAWDIDAMREVDFTEEYLREVTKTARDPEIILNSIRCLLYQQPDPLQTDTIETILKDTKREPPESWNKIKNLLPQRESGLAVPESIEERKALVAFLESFRTLDHLKGLEAKLTAGENSLAKWSNKLDVALDELGQWLD